MQHDRLGQLLIKYADEFNQGAPPDPTLLEEVRNKLPEVSDPREFQRIASDLWDRFFCVDVDLMIEVLRRWLEIEPGSTEAQRALGSYLLAHGPDWDEEGHRLLAQANSSTSLSSSQKANLADGPGDERKLNQGGGAFTGTARSRIRTHSWDELTCFIEAAGESANIEAKGPMAWDGGEASAGLTKDILALANSRDGGVIVIGKDEPDHGKFVLTGLTEPQALSFDTTKVATWVNNHCSPPVSLVCHRQEHQGRLFVVLAVTEFHDVPVICTKHYELPGKPAKVLLRKGAVYVRTVNAESAPLSTVEEMRGLIGLATTKRGDQMLAMFQAMLKGRPLLEVKPDEELFQAEREEVQAALDSEFGGQASLGAWTFLCHPVCHQAARWEETDTLKKVIERSLVRVRQEFPPISYGMHVREWGICNRHDEDAFGLTRSGLFMSIRPFRENTGAFRNPWQPNPDIPAGQWLDFKLNLSLVIEFFMFLSRFAESFEVGEEVVYEVAAGPLAGRRLASMDANINLDPTEACREGTFRHNNIVTVETMRASWEELCVKTLHAFFEFFPGLPISKETLLQWVEKFKERRIG